MTDELSAISVGLSVNLGTLDRDIAKIQKQVKSVEGDHFINFKVGPVNVAEVRKQLRTLTQSAIPVPINVTVARGSAAALRRELIAQFRTPIAIPVKANLSVTDVNRIRAEITQRLGRVPINLRVGGVAGGGGGATTISATLTPHERRVADDLAVKVGAQVTRGAARSGAARAAPLAPGAASSGAVGVGVAQRASQGHPSVLPTVAARTSAKPIRPGPLGRAIGKAGVEADFGTVPTGPAGNVTRRYDAKGNLLVGPPPKPRGVAKYLQKGVDRRAGQTLGMNELAAAKSRTQAPETAEEQEYASRPMAVSYHGKQEEMEYQQEKRGRGVRGASRSGARQRNEPVLTDMDRLSTENQSGLNEVENSATRQAELTAPARRSAAYYGSAGGRLHASLAKLQFYKMDPAFGEAYGLLQKDDIAGARAALTGASQRLAGADPRQRRKFFKLFKNVEKVPPALLEKDAALRALFSEIHSRVDPNFTNVGSASTLAGVGGGAKKTTTKGTPRNTIDKDIASMNDGSMTRAEFEVRHPQFKKLEGGGPVEGPLQRRIRMAREAKAAYLVGEKKPELFVGDSGRVQIVGEHGPEIRTFPESGTVKPFVPEWIKRGMAKDLTEHRETGGPVRGFGGRAFRSFVPGEKEAITGGVLTRATSAAVQRVFVVNFPGGGKFATQPQGAGVAAGPTRSQDDIEARIGKQLKQLFAATQKVQPQQPEKEGPTPALTPEEKVRSRIEAISGASPRELRAQLTNIKAGLTETQAQSPVRSLAPAFGQIVATRLGRGELLSRLAKARDLTAQATRAEGLYNSQVEQEIKIQKQLDSATDPKKRVQLTKALEEQSKATAAAKTNMQGLVGEAEGAAKSADALSLKFGTLVGNTVGIIGGTLAFGATLGLAQAGLGALTQVAGPLIERLTGFQNKSAEVTSALADQTRQQGGAVKSTVALAEAQAGLSKSAADIVSPMLEQRAQTEAGNKALQEGINLLHSYEAVRGQNANRGGVDQGLTRTTGGLFGSIINGIPSTSEQIANELANVQQPGQRQQSNAYIQELQGTLAGMSPEEQKGSRGRALQKALDYQQSLVGATDGLDTSKGRIDFFNEAIRKGGEKFQFVAQSDLPKLDQATRDLAANAADAAGAFDIGNNIRDKRTILVDSLGNIVTKADDVSKALQAVNVGLTTADPALLLKGMQRTIQAQMAQIRAQGQLQRNVTIPAQLALQQAAQPTPGLKGGPGFTAGLVGRDLAGKIDKESQKLGDAAAAKLKPVVDYVNTQIDKGRQALIDIVPPDLRGQFTGILDDITKTGQAISKIQIAGQQRQTNLAVAEYNNQLRIARRSLGDIKDEQAAIKGATIDTVGGIEGENIRLGRQLQLLQFAVQQRSITTDLAVAKFQAPGDTPEERFARQQEAETKARIAQQQLDLSKQIAGNQYQSITMPNGELARQAQDLKAQIDLLTQGREITIKANIDQRSIDVLTAKEDLLVKQAQSIIDEGTQAQQAIISAAAQIVQQTGGEFKQILSMTATAWGVFGSQAKLIMDALTGAAPGGGGVPQGHPEHGATKNAAGSIGLTHGKMILGEAGGEAYAILKQPQLAPVQSMPQTTTSAPQATFIFQLQGAVIREDSDIEKMFDEFERRMSTKLQMLGVRTPSY